MVVGNNVYVFCERNFWQIFGVYTTALVKNDIASLGATSNNVHQFMETYIFIIHQEEGIEEYEEDIRIKMEREANVTLRR